MRDALKVSSKPNSTPHADVKVGGLVPHENTYIVELFRLVKSSLPSVFPTNIEITGPSASGAGIVVRFDTRVVVKVMAHESNGSILERVDKFAHMYSPQNGVNQAWVSSLILTLASLRGTNYSCCRSSILPQGSQTNRL